MTEIESNKLFEFFLMPLSQKKKMLVVSRLAVSVACYYFADGREWYRSPPTHVLFTIKIYPIIVINNLSL